MLSTAHKLTASPVTPKSHLETSPHMHVQPITDYSCPCPTQDSCNPAQAKLMSLNEAGSPVPPDLAQARIPAGHCERYRSLRQPDTNCCYTRASLSVPRMAPCEQAPATGASWPAQQASSARHRRRPLSSSCSSLAWRLACLEPRERLSPTGTLGPLASSASPEAWP